MPHGKGNGGFAILAQMERGTDGRKACYGISAAEEAQQLNMDGVLCIKGCITAAKLELRIFGIHGSHLNYLEI